MKHRAQSCTTLDPTRGSGRVGSGRVRKFTGKGGSGRVGSSSARGLNLILKCLDICILFCILVCTMFQLYIHYLPCSFQCMMWRMMNLYQRGVTLWHDYLLLAASAVDMPPSLSSSVALFYSKLRQQTVISRLYTLLAHMSSHKNINAPKLDYCNSL